MTCVTVCHKLISAQWTVMVGPVTERADMMLWYGEG